MEELASCQGDKQYQMEVVQKFAELEQEFKKLRLLIQVNSPDWSITSSSTI